MKTLNINEACKLAKNMTTWRMNLAYLLDRTEYIYDITEEHQKKASNPEAENETKKYTDKFPKEYEVSADEIIAIIQDLTHAKADLSKAIETAKNQVAIDVGHTTLNLDSAIEYNKGLRDFIFSLNKLNNAKDNVVVETQSRDYKLDNEGKQTPYYYTVKSTKKLIFDKDKAKDLRKEIKALADRISVDIDKAKLNTNIEIDIDYDVNDTIEDIITRYQQKHLTAK